MKKHAIVVLHEQKSQMLQYADYLEKEEYQVFRIEGIKNLSEKIEQLKPSLLILPVETSLSNGIDLCSELRSHPSAIDLCIMLFSQKQEEFSQIAGLESGADDFLFQPVHERVLLGRIKALLKRKDFKKITADTQELVVDEERYVILKHGAEIYLPKKEFEILSLLYSKPSKVFTREEITSKIWSNFEDVRGRTIDVHVRNIREKLGFEYIKTVKGVGYSLEL